MTSRLFTKRFFFGAAVAASLLIVPLVLAAQPRGPHGRGGFDRGRGGPMRLLRELDLTDAQREQVKAIFDEARTSGTMKRMMEARKALEDAVQSGTADEGTLRQLAYDLGEVEGDAAVERAQIHARILQLLTPEQREKLQTLQKEREEEMAKRRQRFEERRQRFQNGGNPDSL